MSVLNRASKAVFSFKKTAELAVALAVVQQKKDAVALNQAVSAVSPEPGHSCQLSVLTKHRQIAVA